MKGWGLRIQIGRTSITPRWSHPVYWVETSLMNPKEYGFGIWITHDLWAGR
jgi:hypothetical protein